MEQPSFLFASGGDDRTEQARRIGLAVAAVQAHISAIAAGICPTCHQPITLEKRGDMVYALPCGHRLYHGNLPPQTQPDQAGERLFTRRRARDYDTTRTTLPPQRRGPLSYCSSGCRDRCLC